MSERTCCIDGCESRHYGRGFCNKHYQRWRKGDPKLASIAAPPFTAEARSCSIDGCERPHSGLGLCSLHYGRARASDPRSPLCEAEGCARPRVKRGWCDSHYSRWHRNGSVADADQSWVVGPRDDCIVCGDPVPEGIGFRKYCGRSCASTAHGYEVRPQYIPCALCGGKIDLTQRYESGRLRYSSQRTCDNCRPPSHLTKWAPRILERDGGDCSLCGVAINFALAYPDPMSRSIDHVIPRSRGGADSFENYALAHLICNVRKNNRLPREVVTP